MERSRRLLEHFQEKLLNDPEFDCLLSLKPKADASVQINPESLMSIASVDKTLSITQTNDHVGSSQERLSRSCDINNQSHDLKSQQRFCGIENLQRNLADYQHKLNFIASRLAHRYPVSNYGYRFVSALS